MGGRGQATPPWQRSLGEPLLGLLWAQGLRVGTSPQHPLSGRGRSWSTATRGLTSLLPKTQPAATHSGPRRPGPGQSQRCPRLSTRSPLPLRERPSSPVLLVVTAPSATRPAHKQARARALQGQTLQAEFGCAETTTLEPQGLQRDTQPRRELLEASTGRECRVLTWALGHHPGEPRPRGRCPPSQLSREAGVVAVRQGSAANSRPLVWGSVPEAGRPTGTVARGPHTGLSWCGLLSTFPRPQGSDNNACSVISRVEREAPPRPPHTPLSGSQQDLGTSRAERPEPFTHFRA